MGNSSLNSEPGDVPCESQLGVELVCEGVDDTHPQAARFAGIKIRRQARALVADGNQNISIAVAGNANPDFAFGSVGVAIFGAVGNQLDNNQRHRNGIVDLHIDAALGRDMDRAMGN